MKEITAKIICEVCKGTLISGNENSVIEEFSIDTRTIKPKDMYIALKGENADGNKYIKDAFKKGAIGCITDENIDYKDKIIIKVKDTLKAMQDLATYKRSLYDIPVVAITGSVGKTSTKDIVAGVLSQKYKVLKTEGNFNNHIGLPLTLLKLKDHTAVTVEMGMNHFGEIRTLTNIAKPTVAVITNIGTSHIGNLGSRENILKAKLEILEGLKDSKTVVINNDNDLLHKWAQTVENYIPITYGIENKSEFTAQNIVETFENTTFDINVEKEEYNVKVPVVGTHFVYNSLCAFAVGKYLGLSVQDIIDGIAKFKLTEKRMDFRKIKNNATVLADYYNASFDSMKSALDVVGKYKKRKIAVLGDMLELGEYAKSLHEKVGEEVVKNNIDILITVGDLAKNIVNAAQNMGLGTYYECKNNEEAVKILKNIIKEDDLILLKASNAMHFGEIFEGINS